MFKRLPYILFNENDPAGAGAATVVATEPAAGATNGNVDVAKLNERLTALENNNANLVKEKRELEGKLKEIKDGELIKKGDLQKLLDDTKTELETIKPEYESLKSQLAEIKAQQELEKTELINTLPTDELKKVGKVLPLTELKILVAANKKGEAIKVDGTSKIQAGNLTDHQKKEAQEMFPYADANKAYEMYAHLKLKKKDN